MFTLLGYSLIAGAFTVVLGASLSSAGPFQRALTAGPLRFIGKRCYGFYLWHCLTGAAVQHACETLAPGGLPMGAKVLLWLGLLTATACASWALFERPILSLKRLCPHESWRAGEAARRADNAAGDGGPNSGDSRPVVRGAMNRASAAVAGRTSRV
jgi:peptidoglycan/LPS O-acetylase OafA/YrhL